MIYERLLGEDLEGGGCGPVEVLSQLLTEGTEHIRQDNRYPGRDSNRESPEYESRALRLDQHTQSFLFSNLEVSSWNIDLVKVTAIGNLKS
jgi:hypothetical protein